MNRSRNTGVALFAAIFLIVVLAGIGITVAVITTTQQVSSGQGLEATRAYYAARARLERAIDEAITNNACPSTGNIDIAGFTTTVTCPAPVPVSEGGANYNVIQITVIAFRGDRSAGTRVRRQLRVQITDL